MNHLAKKLSIKGKQSPFSIAIVISTLLALSGCKIPPLERASCGPSLPATFHMQPSFKKPILGGEAQAAGSAVQAASFTEVQEAPNLNIAPGVSADISKGSQDGANSLANPPSVTPSEPNGPETVPPSLPSGSTIVEQLPISFENSELLSWREFFDDPNLTGLIDQALVGNQELKILAQDIQIANNEVQARRGAYFPFFNLGAGAGLEKPSLFTPQGAVESQLEVLPGKNFPDPLPNFMVATNISWEVDIWRKLRNARDAASLRYLGTRDGRNYIVTRLVAETAQSYYELLALDNRLKTLDKTIEIQEKSLVFSKARKESARGTELAVQRFQAEVRKNQSEKLIIQQSIVEVENQINFIVGRYPQQVERESSEYIDLNLHALSVGVPSQMLQNRPDIRQAERELGATGLDVRVARARFYPSLILGAGVGFRAFNPKYLLTTPDSLIYNVAGDLVGPLINRAAIKADYLTANAKQLQAIYDYQRTILNAYIEVINRISKVENYRNSIVIKKQQLEALESSVDNATKLYQSGRVEYMEVLFAQRDLQDVRLILIETKQQQLSAIVNTYQALGGGGF